MIVFPDLSKNGNTFKEWDAKIKEYEKKLPNTHFEFSDYLEIHSSEAEKEEGYDLADHLEKFDWRFFRNKS